MAGHGEKLSRKQEQAIISLLSLPTIGEAAKNIGIGETTLWRWLQLPDFNERYRAARKQAVSQAVARLQQATTIAVDTLTNVMQDVESKDSARVAAAKTVLEMAFKAVEIEELQSKVEELEQLVSERLEGKERA